MLKVNQILPISVQLSPIFVFRPNCASNYFWTHLKIEFRVSLRDLATYLCTVESDPTSDHSRGIPSSAVHSSGNPTNMRRLLGPKRWCSAQLNSDVDLPGRAAGIGWECSLALVTTNFLNLLIKIK